MTKRITGARMVLVGVSAMVLVALIVSFIARPDDEPPPRFTSPSAEEMEDAAVIVTLTIENVDAVKGSMKVRLAASAGENFPVEGATLFSSLDAVPRLSVTAEDLVKETSAELPFTNGDVADYPFDRYSAELELLAVAGSDTPLTVALTKDPVPLVVIGVDNGAGFVTTAEPRLDDDMLVVDLRTERKDSSVWWATAMMGIYWLLAASVLAVTLTVVLGSRIWETRHLAWLGAMIFALTSFHNAAPGSPPIGTFFDFFAFFWAEAIVALCLVALVVYYLVVPRERLKL